MEERQKCDGILWLQKVEDEVLIKQVMVEMYLDKYLNKYNNRKGCLKLKK